MKNDQRSLKQHAIGHEQTDLRGDCNETSVGDDAELLNFGGEEYARGREQPPVY